MYVLYFKVKLVKLNKKFSFCKLFSEFASGLMYRDGLFALLLQISFFFFLDSSFWDNIYISSLEHLRRERMRGRDRTFFNLTNRYSYFFFPSPGSSSLISFYIYREEFTYKFISFGM